MAVWWDPADVTIGNPTVSEKQFQLGCSAIDKVKFISLDLPGPFRGLLLEEILICAANFKDIDLAVIRKDIPLCAIDKQLGCRAASRGASSERPRRDGGELECSPETCVPRQRRCVRMKKWLWCMHVCWCCGALFNLTVCIELWSFPVKDSA